MRWCPILIKNEVTRLFLMQVSHQGTLHHWLMLFQRRRVLGDLSWTWHTLPTLRNYLRDILHMLRSYMWIFRTTHACALWKAKHIAKNKSVIFHLLQHIYAIFNQPGSKVSLNCWTNCSLYGVIWICLLKTHQTFFIRTVELVLLDSLRTHGFGRISKESPDISGLL